MQAENSVGRTAPVPAEGSFAELQKRIGDLEHQRDKLSRRLQALTQPAGDDASIRFEDLFDIDDIQAIQDAFSDATGVAAIITDVDGIPITKPSNFSALCLMIRGTPAGLVNCIRSDKELGTLEDGNGRIAKCLSAGFWDGGTSINVGARPIAKWLIGQVVDESLAEDEVLAYTTSIGVDAARVRAALPGLVRMSKEQFEKVHTAVALTARQLSFLALQIIQQARAITERKHAEQSIKESEKKFRTLFEYMTEGVALHEMIYDENGNGIDYKILDVNPAYSRHTGLVLRPDEQPLGRQLYGTETPPYLEEFGRVAATGESFSFETYFPPLEKHFRIIVISPKRGTFATVFEDITERKIKEEELRQKNEELERFTYTVSHDLKSPLVTVKTFLGFLAEDMKANDGERMDKDMAFIHAAANKMSHLLDELLDLSRVGRKMNPYVETPLQTVVREALDLVAGRILERKASITVTDAPVVVFGDVQRLIEVFQNLVDNAVKFMGTQLSPMIEIGVEQHNAEVVLFIRDNGIGIDPRHKSKLFGLFEKLNPGTEGTGIGLALAKRIVEVHGGRIWAESDGIGLGTTFRFTLAKTKILH